MHAPEWLVAQRVVEPSPPGGRFKCHQLLRSKQVAESNRRMRKTARPVVWESDGAESPALDPIRDLEK